MYDAYAKTPSSLKKMVRMHATLRAACIRTTKILLGRNMDGFRVQYPEELNPIYESLCMLNKHTKGRR